MTKWSDLNLKIAPEATALLLRLPIPKTIIPIEVCIDAPFTKRQLDALLDGCPESTLASRHADRVRAWWTRMLLEETALFGTFRGFVAGGPFPWDPIALAWAVPSLRDRFFDVSDAYNVAMAGDEFVATPCAECAPTQTAGVAVMPRKLANATAFVDFLVAALCAT